MRLVYVASEPERKIKWCADIFLNNHFSSAQHIIHLRKKWVSKGSTSEQ